MPLNIIVRIFSIRFCEIVTRSCVWIKFASSPTPYMQPMMIATDVRFASPSCSPMDWISTGRMHSSMMMRRKMDAVSTETAFSSTQTARTMNSSLKFLKINFSRRDSVCVSSFCLFFTD